MASRRLVAALAVVALAPSAAAAQFTTFVAPPKKDTIVAVDSAIAAAPTADSSARATIANMKAWVDSAAGGAVNLSDTTSRIAAVDGGQVAAFSDGAPAPDTATPLPMLVTLGVSAVGAGAYLLRRK